MKKELFIKNLTIVTIAVLSGIISLQIYWLISSYRQQESRFKTDVQNALSSANSKVTLRKAWSVKDNGPLQLFHLETLSKEMENSERTIKVGKQRVINLPLSEASIKPTDTLKLLNYLKKALNGKNPVIATNIRLEISRPDILVYRATFGRELIRRGIYIPYEFAVVSQGDHILWSSCDSNQYKRISFKSAEDEFSQAEGMPSTGLQAAFPNVNMYLFRKMIWVLSVTILLIVIGSFSLGYLFLFFFKQKKLSDMRNSFMNNMTHELKTPISSVSVALEMIVNKSTEISAEKKLSYLSAAQKELKRLDLLTETILSMLSMEKSEIEIEKSIICTKAWLQTIADSLRPLTDNRSADIKITIVPQAIKLFADKIHMTNVMYNMIENAVKYNNKKRPEIQIYVQEKNNYVSIEVRDNGEGIPAQYLKNVFDKFFRVPKGNRHDVKGYGLGLSYVKGIIEKHNGSIQVSSILDKGSIFTIKLPIN